MAVNKASCRGLLWKICSCNGIIMAKLHTMSMHNIDPTALEGYSETNEKWFHEKIINYNTFLGNGTVVKQLLHWVGLKEF